MWSIGHPPLWSINRKIVKPRLRQLLFLELLSKVELSRACQFNCCSVFKTTTKKLIARYLISTPHTQKELVLHRTESEAGKFQINSPCYNYASLSGDNGASLLGDNYDSLQGDNGAFLQGSSASSCLRLLWHLWEGSSSKIFVINPCKTLWWSASR